MDKDLLWIVLILLELQTECFISPMEYVLLRRSLDDSYMKDFDIDIEGCE